MATPTFGQLTGEETLTELIDRVAKLQKMVEWLMGGRLSTDNIREIGGWDVDETQLVSKDGDVGMSTEDTAADDVRFFAGSTDKETAPFKVRKSGKMEATGAVIKSSSGYPVVLIDPSGNLFGAYLDGNNFFEIKPAGNGYAPTLYWVAGGSTASELVTSATDFNINVIARELNLTTEVQGNINLSPALGYAVFVPGWSELLSAATGQPLQTDLDTLSGDISTLNSQMATKATAGASTSSVGNHNHGIPDGAQLLGADGVTVYTFSASGGHAHTQT